MQANIVDLGFSVADAEGLSIEFREGDLVLAFQDWRERRVMHRFRDVLAFRLGSCPSVRVPRGDSTFVVEGSAWLREECSQDGVDALDHAHYVLCFNAEKTLEILAGKSTGIS